MLRATLLDAHFPNHVWVVLDEEAENEKPVVFAKNIPDDMLAVYLGAYPGIVVEDKRTGRKPSADKPESYPRTGVLRRGGFSVL